MEAEREGEAGEAGEAGETAEASKQPSLLKRAKMLLKPVVAWASEPWCFKKRAS